MDYKIFGCKVNKYYTDKWLNSEKLKGKNGIFIASCVVTDNAKRKWIKFVKDTAKNIKKEETIFISGCGAFKNGKAQNNFFELYPDLEYLKEKIIILNEDPELNNNNNNNNRKNISNKLNNIPQIYTKKFILIQGGCDSFCTFCLTVKKRGRHFSRTKEDILDEILIFEKNGGKEVVLTGINLSAWGLDTTNDIGKSKFAELINYLLKNTKIPRIRISSMGPEFITNEVLKLFENPRIYPHFHYSVQSGSSNILKSMSRHYDGKYIKDLLLKTRQIKRKDNVKVSIGADIIVGFPGETEDDFKDTLNLIKDCNITKVHAFPFSGHELGEDVPAGKFPGQVDGKIKKDRMWEIMNLSDQIRDKFIEENIGKTLEVLIESVKTDEKTGKIKWKGWTQNYIEADQSNFEIISGEIKRNKIIIGKLTK
ncbi:MiaB/RimO family radical SAM methylthiotransferase [Candidatus Gracilibacteria bacterium]|nr:MiaB/RimO family radical SAM methylthiotransferase [Candidatus Gracilibacteria bacterium]